MTGRVVLCDYDAPTRALTRRVAEEAGFEVIGETDHVLDAIALLEQFGPDVVVTDFGLTVGSGEEVIEAARDHGCAVIVFTAFASQATVEPPVVAVVRKPDFDRLGDALNARSAARGGSLTDRRTWHGAPTVTPRPVGGVSDPEPDFYQALTSAHAGDSIIALRPAHPALLPELAAAVRRTLRVADWLLVQPSRLVVLLVGGHVRAGDSFKRRLPPEASGCEVTDALISDGEEPSDAFSRLTRRSE